jgi:hypothetical protein
MAGGYCARPCDIELTGASDLSAPFAKTATVNRSFVKSTDTVMQQGQPNKRLRCLIFLTQKTKCPESADQDITPGTSRNRQLQLRKFGSAIVRCSVSEIHPASSTYRYQVRSPSPPGSAWGRFRSEFGIPDRKEVTILRLCLIKTVG